MKIIIIFLLSVSMLVRCGNAVQKNPSQNDNRELVPEPEKPERLRYEALQQLRNSGCVLLDPDTSVLSLKIRDTKSGKTFIRNDKPGYSDEYRFYSNDFRELLRLTQHPGDGKYQISVFNVGYSKKEDYGYTKLKTDTIKTEKGICLGMPKAEIIRLLGNCYAALDSTNEYMELYYRIEAPKDTRTRLLSNHNTPVYYASYKIRNGGLEAFEFGFEYP